MNTYKGEEMLVRTGFLMILFLVLLSIVLSLKILMISLRLRDSILLVPVPVPSNIDDGGRGTIISAAFAPHYNPCMFVSETSNCMSNDNINDVDHGENDDTQEDYDLSAALPRFETYAQL